MTSITIELPIPAKCLHKNNPWTHWGTVSTAKKKARSLARILASSELARQKKAAPKWVRATLRAEWYFRPAKRGKALREHDDDGLTGWLVAYRDGLEDAGIVANDSGIVTLPHTVGVDKANPRVVLTVEQS